MTILVSGSLALDHIMVFPDRFKDHILPDKIHILNVSFNIASLRTHFGGVAGNIAYHLRLLGEEPWIVATAGSDFGPYADWLDRHGIRRDGIRVLEDLRTAQGFVTTDLDDNQIWAFYEGAMGRAHEALLPPPAATPRLAIVSSDSRRAMLERARELKRRGVATYVDPSHALPILEREELLELVDGAAGYIVNDYELSLTEEKLRLGAAEIARRCGALVVTRGEQGSTIREGEREIEIPPVPARQVVDPTACGDAYRAGLLAGRARGLSFELAGRMGSLLGSYQVEVEGPQALRLDPASFGARFEREFGLRL